MAQKINEPTTSLMALIPYMTEGEKLFSKLVLWTSHTHTHTVAPQLALPVHTRARSKCKQNKTLILGCIQYFH